MKGFNIDKNGNLLSLAQEWEPVYTDEEGNEVAVNQPANTFYPENFDGVIQKMTNSTKRSKFQVVAGELVESDDVGANKTLAYYASKKADEESQADYLESDEYKTILAEKEAAAKLEASKTNADKAFEMLILNYGVKASYPDKVSAMDKAVEKLSLEASKIELYEVAVEVLK